MDDRLCNKQIRGGTCQLEAGHKGQHSTIAYSCDSCGKVRRGQPHVSSHVYLGDGTIDDTFGYCFLCVIEANREI